MTCSQRHVWIPAFLFTLLRSTNWFFRACCDFPRITFLRHLQRDHWQLLTNWGEEGRANIVTFAPLRHKVAQFSFKYSIYISTILITWCGYHVDTVLSPRPVTSHYITLPTITMETALQTFLSYAIAQTLADCFGPFLNPCCCISQQSFLLKYSASNA